MKDSRGRRLKLKSWHAIIGLSLLAALMLGWYSKGVAAEVALATGPPSAAQEAFFVQLAERPDSKEFFEGLTSDQRVRLAQNLAVHDAPEIPKLVTKLIDTLDEPARQALSNSMLGLAKVNPDAVADGLGAGSSFAKAATNNALEALGADAIPIVVKKLEGGTGEAAARFLAERKSLAEDALISAWNSDSIEVRVNAAKALGWMRSPRGGEVIDSTLETGPTPDNLKKARAIALAQIANPRDELKLRNFLQNEDKDVATQAAVGLGLIGTSEAVADLWTVYRSDNPEMKNAAWTGLQLAGDIALTSDRTSLEEKLSLARHIKTPAADRLIVHSLTSEQRLDALAAATGRPNLVPHLLQFVSTLDSKSQGDVADSALEAVVGSVEGRAALRKWAETPAARAWRGMAERRLSLAQE